MTNTVLQIWLELLGDGIHRACAASSNSFMLTRMHELKRVLVVGAGTMGSQIALQTALSGRYEVALVDSVPGQLEKPAPKPPPPRQSSRKRTPGRAERN